MNILICIKQVIDLEDELTVREDGRWISLDEDTGWHLNYYDEFAVEEAVRIKERLADVTVDALSLGPARVETALRQALALGADQAIHLETEETDFISADGTAGMIAAAIAPRHYDLIMTGVMSEDIMQRLTGPMIAARCGLPCAASVVEANLSADQTGITAVCELEGGFRESMQLSLPALLTIQSGINRPRYASLSNRLRAKSQEIERIDTRTLSAPISRRQIRAVYVPEKTGTGLFLEGSAEEKARSLINRLHEKSII